MHILDGINVDSAVSRSTFGVRTTHSREWFLFLLTYFTFNLNSSGVSLVAIIPTCRGHRWRLIHPPGACLFLFVADRVPYSHDFYGMHLTPAFALSGDQKFVQGCPR